MELLIRKNEIINCPRTSIRTLQIQSLVGYVWYLTSISRSQSILTTLYTFASFRCERNKKSLNYIRDEGKHSHKIFNLNTENIWHWCEKISKTFDFFFFMINFDMNMQNSYKPSLTSNVNMEILVLLILISHGWKLGITDFFHNLQHLVSYRKLLGGYFCIWAWYDACRYKEARNVFTISKKQLLLFVYFLFDF